MDFVGRDHTKKVPSPFDMYRYQSDVFGIRKIGHTAAWLNTAIGISASFRKDRKQRAVIEEVLCHLYARAIVLVGFSGE